MTSGTTRQLLLGLYGATAELSNAWQSILPWMEEIEPLSSERSLPSSSKLPQYQGKSTSRAQVGLHLLVCISRLHLLLPTHPVRPPRSMLRSYSVQSPGVESERTKMMRRHAGPFSSKDVEIWKMLPSHVDLLPVTPRIPSRKYPSL